jgi:hypothetical protein
VLTTSLLAAAGWTGEDTALFFLMVGVPVFAPYFLIVKGWWICGLCFLAADLAAAIYLGRFFLSLLRNPFHVPNSVIWAPLLVLTGFSIALMNLAVFWTFVILAALLR